MYFYLMFKHRNWILSQHSVGNIPILLVCLWWHTATLSHGRESRPTLRSLNRRHYFRIEYQLVIYLSKRSEAVGRAEQRIGIFRAQKGKKYHFSGLIENEPLFQQKHCKNHPNISKCIIEFLKFALRISSLSFSLRSKRVASFVVRIPQHFGSRRNFWLVVVPLPVASKLETGTPGPCTV